MAQWFNIPVWAVARGDGIHFQAKNKKVENKLLYRQSDMALGRTQRVNIDADTQNDSSIYLKSNRMFHSAYGLAMCNWHPYM